MRSLLIFARGNTCILYGTISSIWQKECEISGNIFNPKEKAFVERSIHVFWDKPEQIKSLTLGCKVSLECTVKDIGLLTILEGGYTSASLFAIGKRMKYSGVYDYPATETSKESNVFLATVTDIKSAKTSEGEAVTNLTVSYRWFYKNFEKSIAVFNSNQSFELEKQYVFVCGSQNESQSYIARRIYECD